MCSAELNQIQERNGQTDILSGAVIGNGRERAEIAPGLQPAYDERTVTFISCAPLLEFERDPEDPGKLIRKVKVGGLSTALADLAGQRPSMHMIHLHAEHDGKTGVFSRDIREELKKKDAKEGLEAQIEPYGVSMRYEQYRTFYEKVSNGLLWPAMHGINGQAAPVDDEMWECYRAVNRRFAEETLKNSHGPIWVHDYHLMPLPEEVRRLRGERKHADPIGYFHHIPWPEYATLEKSPVSREQLWQIVQGLLGADLVGFQTQDHARNFLECARRLGFAVTQEIEPGAPPQSEGMVTVDRRKIWVGAYPIGLDPDRIEAVANSEEVQHHAAFIRKKWGRFPIPKTEKGFLLFGVERLDYTKGVLERLEAMKILLRDYPKLIGKVRLVQFSSDTRRGVPAYEEYRQKVLAKAHEINSKDYRVSDWVPIEFSPTPLEPDEIYANCQAADVIVVTPLRDGMNLVVQEAVLSSRPETAFVLGSGTGSATILKHAYQVNGGSPEEIAKGMYAAIADLDKNPDDVRERHQKLLETVRYHNIGRWGDNFLFDLKVAHRLNGNGRLSADGNGDGLTEYPMIH